MISVGLEKYNIHFSAGYAYTEMFVLLIIMIAEGIIHHQEKHIQQWYGISKLGLLE